MIIIKFWGGLGNQLFIYALYRELKNRKYEVKVDTDWYKVVGERDWELEKLGLDVEEATDSEKRRFLGSKNKSIKFMNKLVRGRKYYSRILLRQEGYGFDGRVFEVGNGYFEGYWQSPKYFQTVNEILRKEIQLEPQGYFEETYHLLKADSNSCFIHLRFGDYLGEEEDYGGICTEEYYEKAVEYIAQKIKDVSFYVFSDDMKSAKKYLSNVFKCNTKVIYMDEFNISDGEDTTYRDLVLMSMCRNAIIANSSFSWWGAWLSENINKIVIAPAKWCNRGIWDIWCDGWIRI